MTLENQITQLVTDVGQQTTSVDQLTQTVIDQLGHTTNRIDTLIETVNEERAASQNTVSSTLANLGMAAASGGAPGGFVMLVKGRTISIRCNRLILTNDQGLGILAANINLAWASNNGLIKEGLLAAGAGWRYVWLISDGQAAPEIFVSDSSASPAGAPEGMTYRRYCGAVWVHNADFDMRYAQKEGNGAVRYLDNNLVQDGPIGALAWREFNHESWVPPHVPNVLWDIAMGNTHGCFRVTWENGNSCGVQIMGWMHSDDWMGYQYDFPLPQTKQLWLHAQCGDQHTRIMIRGYREEPVL